MVKARDMSRPTHYERNNDIVDLGSNQYPSVDWTRSMAANKDFPKPYYISEYAHNMMNAMGNLADYWEAIESSDRIMGGAIWDWVDQGLYKTLPNGGRCSPMAATSTTIPTVASSCSTAPSWRTVRRNRAILKSSMSIRISPRP